MFIQNTDTIQTQGTAIAEEAVAVHHSGQLTPAQVLSWLPKSATPAQQDSAIRAHIKIKPITYSSRPDTLGTPCTKPDLHSCWRQCCHICIVGMLHHSHGVYISIPPVHIPSGKELLLCTTGKDYRDYRNIQRASLSAIPSSANLHTILADLLLCR